MDLEEAREEYESEKSRYKTFESICYLLLAVSIFMGIGWFIGGVLVGFIILFRGWTKNLKESYELSLTEEAIKRSSEKMDA